MAKAEQCSSGERGPVPLAWANWPAEMGTSLPQPSRPCPAAARTFSPSTTSNSTVSPSPTLRKNFLGLFLLMAVWQGKGHEKGEGGKPGVSLTPAGCATPFRCVHRQSSVWPGRRAERGRRPSSVGEKPQSSPKQPSPRACALGLSLGRSPSSLYPSGTSQGEAASRPASRPKRRGALSGSVGGRLCGAGLGAPARGSGITCEARSRPGPPPASLPRQLWGGAGVGRAGDAAAAGTTL